MTVFFPKVSVRCAGSAAALCAALALGGCISARSQYAPYEGYQTPPPTQAPQPQYPISQAAPAAPAVAASASGTGAAAETDSPSAADVSEPSSSEPTQPVNHAPGGSESSGAPITTQPLEPLETAPSPAPPPPPPAPPPPPEPAAMPEPAYTPPAPRPAPVVRLAVSGAVVKSNYDHEVEVHEGETVNSISASLMTSKDAVIKANRLKKPYDLEIGRKLKIPTSKAYVVQPGDTLYSISHRFSMPAATLSQLNDFADGERLKPGQKIALPDGAKDLGPTRITVAAAAGPAPAPAPQKPRAHARAPVQPPPAASESTLSEESPPPPPPPPPPSRPIARVSGATMPSGPVPYSQTGPRQVQPPLKVYPGMYPTQPAYRSATVQLPPSRSYPPPQPPQEAPAPVLSDAEITQLGRGRFAWPVSGSVLSAFGIKPGGQRNDGVDLAADEGTPVHAAAGGEVVYAGDQIPGFGNLVLIKHDNGWVTAYAHLARSEVKIRQHVDQGMQIGEVGETGGVSQPELHFEIRYAPTPHDKARPIDPNLVLDPQP